ncbi:MAG: hypothetical protein ACTHJ0_05290 [Flavipsychrobacter sp.]
MELNNIALNSQNITLENHGKVPEFCKLWGDAENVLQTLESIIKNPIAKAAISIVIAAGNAVTKEVCPESGLN